jgi:CPA2 family monovalent cation:H+ antiporter-2
MEFDPIMPDLVGVILVLICVAFAARALRQPYVIGYIIAGFAIGPEGLGLIQDGESVSRLGSFGVMLLLFFIGLETSPQRLGQKWAVALLGTTLQILLTVGAVVGFGWVVGWQLGRSVLFGFIIALSSTAVTMKLLQDWGEINTPVGREVTAVLLAQDLAVVPMMIVIGMLQGAPIDHHTLALQLASGLSLLALALWSARRKPRRLPFGRWIRSDHELQVLGALAMCFGLALLSGLTQLSTALGAFVAGVIIGSAEETQWVEESLRGFRVIFIAMFFVSIGLLIDIDFLLENWLPALTLVFTAIICNTGINAAVLRLFGRPWPRSIYAGALLSQIGEFSFVLAAMGRNEHIIGPYRYQMTITVIALTLMLSPAWISGTKALLRRRYDWAPLERHPPVERAGAS